ncbi:hypothetical protein GO013_07790 [Pseudodesulfovibrio sp. JC047]|uniref:OmpP1/FadL family transporter n=1 Tax=Pseudodesulfovibrio sp. JC047 TaxID=2683199 RepID=UPI0013D69B28|nr:outer membrane protein transport protein [Pseudodesulfovibrio sp. JC047]NDV19317.1 hypothetical protein [Pseudodesulfovibrio sp. JC047]
MKRTSAVFYCSLVLCLLASAATVHAGGFALYEWGNRALGMGTANYATGNDASVIAYNPAQMTKLEGTNLYGGVAVITPMSDVYIDGNKNTTKSVSHAIPHVYATHQLNDKWVIGIGEFTRFGLGTKYDKNWDGKTLLNEALLESYSFNPSVGYRVNDSLSVGGGVEVIKGSFLLKKDVNALVPVLGGSHTKIDVAGTSTGFNLGMLYDVTDAVSLALTYRSSVHFVGHGDVHRRSGEYLWKRDPDR